MAPSPDAIKKSLGRFGETYACHELARRGYEIVARNVRMRNGEIDIVARHGGETVFVEVKTRRPNSVAAPEEAVTDERLSHLEAAIAEYLEQRGDQAYRIEVAAWTFQLRVACGGLRYSRTWTENERRRVPDGVGRMQCDPTCRVVEREMEIPQAGLIFLEMSQAGLLFFPRAFRVSITAAASPRIESQEYPE